MSRYGRRGVKDEKKVKSEHGYDSGYRRRSGDRLNEVQRYAMSKYDPIKFTEPKAPSLSEMPRDPYVIEVDGVRQCALCSVQFTSTTCEMTHLQGKRHRMALQGKILNKKGKRVGPTEDFGRCDVCNVDYTSAQQRNTHVQGKRHIRNVQMAQRGVTPGSRRKRQMNMSGNYGTYQFPGFGNYNYGSNSNLREPLEHEKLQKEVEKMYAEYLEIAKTDMDKAKELYTTYQDKYKRYVNSYNEYAKKYREAQAKRKQEQEERTASNTPNGTTENKTEENGTSNNTTTTTTTTTTTNTNTTTTNTTTDNTPKTEAKTETKS